MDVSQPQCTKYNQATFLAMGLFIENVQYQKSHVIVLSYFSGKRKSWSQT